MDGIELPRYAQGGGYRLLERLLNRVPDLTNDAMFSALPGDFSGANTTHGSTSS